MPAEQSFSAIVESPQSEQHLPQSKVCSFCHLSLDSSINAFFVQESDPIVCSGCREKGVQRDGPLPTDSHTLCLEVDSDRVRYPLQEVEASGLRPTRLIADGHVLEHDTDMGTPPSSSPDTDIAPGAGPSHHSPPISSVDVHHNANHPSFDADSSVPSIVYIQNHISLDLETNSRRTGYTSISSPDPLTDITRIRVRSQSRGCLHPGASFQGTQKSGRNSYDVNVTIVDVDFSTSFLCGYLRIRGLTDDWPELTTYFDAEIIGSRYGFLTQNWGANEQEDMVHWSRFPAFRHVKNELKKPQMTMNDRVRGAVFMRWKERFLVPDHRVQDISGASFAGFYYVCVDFNPAIPVSSSRTGGPQTLSTPEQIDVDCPSPVNSVSPLKVENQQPPRRDPSVRQGRPSPSSGIRASAPVATMNGFYFHQNSEPYQQLTLSHIPERTSSIFEFR